MTSAEERAGETAIRALIGQQAAFLSWSHGRPADWQGFADAFLEGASMIASSRPARAAGRRVPRPNEGLSGGNARLAREILI